MAYGYTLTFPTVPTLGTPFRLPPPMMGLFRVLPYGIALFLIYRIYQEYLDRQRRDADGSVWLPGAPGWTKTSDCGLKEMGYCVAAFVNQCGMHGNSPPDPMTRYPILSSTTRVNGCFPDPAWPGWKPASTWTRTSGSFTFAPPQKGAITVETPLAGVRDLGKMLPRKREDILRRFFPQLWQPGTTSHVQWGAIPVAMASLLPRVALDGSALRSYAIPQPRRSVRPIALPGVDVEGRKIEYPAWVESMRTVAKPGEKVATAPAPHQLTPPKGKTKERKLRSNNGNIARVIWHAVNNVTEACDFVDALYNALPKITRAQYDKKLAAKGNYSRWVRFQSRKMVDGLNTERGAPLKSTNVYDWTSGFQACIWKARIVYKELDLINMDQAIINLARETLTDVAIGKLMQGTNPISQKLGKGVQLGGWDNPHFNPLG